MEPEVINAVSSSPVLPHLMLSIFLWLNTSMFLGTMSLLSFCMSNYFFFVSPNYCNINCLFLFGN